MDARRDEMPQPDSLDDKTAREWQSLADEVLSSRAERASSGVNSVLTAAFEREPQSPAAPAYRLWLADNLARDGRLGDAVAAYDAVIESAQSAPRLLEAIDPAVGALLHKAHAAAQIGATSTAIATFRELASLSGNDPSPLFHAGRLADEGGDQSQAAELYRAAGGLSPPSRRTDDQAELARRALLRLETDPAEFAPSAERAAELLSAALERGNAARVRRLMSSTHFAAGPVGGHTVFETEDLLDALCADLSRGSVEVGGSLLGSGDKRYLPTRGWAGIWFRGDVTFMITRAPRGWRCTGVGIVGVHTRWVERWRPAVERTNQPLPFPLIAPWPVDLSFTAGGLTHYIGQQAVILAAAATAWPFGLAAAAALALGYSSNPCGFGPRGYYYNQGPTHDGDDAFAIDFTRYRPFVPYDNESGGTPVLAARGGIVSHVVEAFPSGYSDDANLVHIEHPDPANAAEPRRFTTRYLHLEGPWAVPVSQGMPVVAGTRLGRMDDTGNSVLDHLHFSIHDRHIPASPGVPYGGSVRPTPLSGRRLEDGDSGACVISTNIEYPGDKPMIGPSSYAGQNWLITPAATAAGAPTPSQIKDQTWILVLTGVAIIDLKGVTASEWRRETVLLQPELSGPLQYAIGRYGIPTPPGDLGYTYTGEFQVEQWAPFAALSSMLNEHESINSGFAVDLWRPNEFATKTDALSGTPLDRLFTGIEVDVAVRDSDAWIHRVSYHITLLGKIAFAPIVIS